MRRWRLETTIAGAWQRIAPIIVLIVFGFIVFSFIVFSFTLLPDGSRADNETPRVENTPAKQRTAAAGAAKIAPGPQRVPENRYTIRKRIDNIKPSAWLRKYGSVEVNPRPEEKAEEKAAKKPKTPATKKPAQ